MTNRVTHPNHNPTGPHFEPHYSEATSRKVWCLMIFFPCCLLQVTITQPFPTPSNPPCFVEVMSVEVKHECLTASL